MATSTWTEHRVVRVNRGEQRVLSCHTDRNEAIEVVNERRRQGDKAALAVQRVEITEVAGPLIWYSNDFPVRRVAAAASGQQSQSRARG